MPDSVKAQYEAYPYPERDPADEAERLIVGSPSHILEIDHYVFGGRAGPSPDWRVLVAGGGTGDGTIMLAQQLASCGSVSEIIYLDLSGAAMAIAKARAEARGLANIRFVEGSLLELPALGLGEFDYIDCCGVLHHLPDPAAGLGALANSLRDGGGLGLMVYGRYGRTGVYEAQEVLRLLRHPDDDETARLDCARRLCAKLPETNWLRRNPLIGDHLGGTDAGLYDLLLHSIDRAYSVPEVFDLATGAGLTITGLLEPMLYAPETFIKDDTLAERAQALAWPDRCALAELVGGHLKNHIFYAVKAASRGDAVASADRSEMVPVMREADAAAIARHLERSGSMRIDLRGFSMTYRATAAGTAILALIDGERSLAEIHRVLDGRSARGLAWERFKAVFDDLYLGLNGFNLMLLRGPQTA